MAPPWYQVSAIAEDKQVIVEHLSNHPDKALLRMDGGEYVACSREELLTFQQSAGRDLLLEQMGQVKPGQIVVARFSDGQFASAMVEVKGRA